MNDNRPPSNPTLIEMTAGGETFGLLYSQGADALLIEAAANFIRANTKLRSIDICDINGNHITAWRGNPPPEL